MTGEQRQAPSLEVATPSRGGDVPTDPATPLAGMRVVELASFVAAPLGAMTLRQLGAEVVRVDLPGGGPDIMRWPLSPEGVSMYWTGLNRGKRSACIDWRTEQGAELVAQLVADSGPEGGVMITNTAGRGALSFAALAERRPDLIHVTVQGRHDGSPAVDYTVNATLGFPHVTGPEGSTSPTNHVLPAWDVVCGLYTATAVLASARHRSGGPQRLTVALEDVALATAGSLGYLAEAEVGGVQRTPIGNALYGAFGRDFESSDGARFMIVTLTPRHWRDLLAATGTEAVVAGIERHVGADFTDEGDRFRHRHLIAPLIAAWFEARPADVVRTALASTSVLWSEYGTFSQLVADSDGRLASNPSIHRLDQPGVGEHWSPGLPVVWRDHHRPAEPAPGLGGDTRAVLSDWLGLSEVDLRVLEESGTIAGPET
jgi:2-methylfumaryl-CoA isomerase